MRDKRIKRCHDASEFRLELCADDVSGGEEFVVYPEVEGGVSEEEVVKVFIGVYDGTAPVRVVYNGFLFNGIRSRYREKDEREPKILNMVVKYFLYINPGLGKEGVVKLAKHVHRYFTKDSEYEEVLRLVKKLWGYDDLGVLFEGEGDLVSDKVLFFKRGTIMPGEVKRKMGLDTRFMRHSYLTGEIIHNAANSAIENSPKWLKVSHGLVVKESMGKVKTVRTVKKHIKPVTISLLEIANESRYFKQEPVSRKFEEFCNKYLKDESKVFTLDGLVEEFKIGKNTAVEFSKKLVEIREKQ